MDPFFLVNKKIEVHYGKKIGGGEEKKPSKTMGEKKMQNSTWGDSSCFHSKVLNGNSNLSLSKSHEALLELMFVESAGTPKLWMFFLQWQ